MMPFLQRYAAPLALVSGALTTLAFAPFNVWLAALVCPAILFLVSEQLTTKRTAFVFWLYGLGLFGSGVSWVYVSINTYGGTHAALAALMTFLFAAGLAIFFAMQGWLYARYFRQSHFRSAGFCGIWLTFEWLRSWLLTGFPWLYLGYGFTNTPYSQLASIGGVWLLSLISLCSSMLFIYLFKAKRLQRIYISLLLTVLATSIWWLPNSWTEATGEKQSVDIVQADISQQLKWEKQYLVDFLNVYKKMTLEQTSADLIIWPETAIPALFKTAYPHLDTLLNQLEQENRTLVSGIPSVEIDKNAAAGYRVYNSLAVLTTGVDIYHKQHLVPFGEYMPFEDHLRGLIAFFNLPMSSFSLPKRAQTALQIKDMQVAAAICYEIAYPELVRAMSKETDWLLTVSNDTWFSHTLAPAQHLQIAQMRAIENGRWLVRSTNNGLTAIINHEGKIVAQAPAYQAAVLRGEIELRSGTTPYQQAGVAPSLLLSGLFLLIAFRRRTKSS